MNEPVSCVVTVCDHAEFLGETLDSVLAQTYEHLQVIVVDDGHALGTRATTRRYGERVEYIESAARGHAAACNAGIGAARGDFIALGDAGDLWLATKTARQMDVLAAHPEAGGCVSLVQDLWPDERHQGGRPVMGVRRGQPVPGYAYISLLARRAAFDAVGLFNTTLQHAADTEWFLRAEARGVKVEFVREVLVTRRIHPPGPSDADVAASRAEHLQVLKQYEGTRMNRTLEQEAQAEDTANETRA